MRWSATPGRVAWEGWRGGVVLGGLAVMVVVPVWAIVDPAFLSSRLEQRLLFVAFIGGLLVSVVGGVVLMLRQNNPWWLLTLPVACLVVGLLLFFAIAAAPALFYSH
jgi:uncharacterized membrane protein